VGDVNSPHRLIDRLLDIKYAVADASGEQKEDLFLVKFKYVSYGQALWLTRKDIVTSMGSMASAYITRYQNKLSKASERWSEDHVYNPAFEVIDRIFNSGVAGDDETMYLCKW
jgi:hypothetical protein